MSRRLRVYIAGPLSGSGDRMKNVKNAKNAAVELIQAGFAPLCPHLTHYIDSTDKLGHATWLEVDLPWVAAAEAVLRLPGSSKGADMECALADRLGIPVYHSFDKLKDRPPRSDQRYLDLLDEMAALHRKKATDYGRGKDPLANLRASEEWGIPSWLGTLVRASDKVHRLKSFALNRYLANEGVEDSLKDLAAYALLALVLYREQAEPKCTQN